MAQKNKKDNKPRPETYEQKVFIDMTFDQAIKKLATKANTTVKTKQTKN